MYIFVIFHPHKTKREAQNALLVGGYHGRQERNVKINKKDLGTKLYMHNTQLRRCCADEQQQRERNYFCDFVQRPKQKFLAFPQPQYVLCMFFFQSHVLIKNGSHKEKKLIKEVRNRPGCSPFSHIIWFDGSK